MSIGQRMRSFGETKFGSINAFARAIGMLPSSLQKYLRDEREPGTRILVRLMEQGCDIIWLLSGKSNESSQEDIKNRRIKELEEQNQKLREGIFTSLNNSAELQKLINSIQAKLPKNR